LSESLVAGDVNAPRGFAGGKSFREMPPCRVLIQGDAGGGILLFAVEKYGQKGINNNVSIDGADNNNPFFGEQRGGWRPLFTVSLDAVTHGQHGPAEGLTILTYAHSPVTKLNEPMDWVRDYGKGRVYTTMLGHTWKNEPNPNDCVGFQTLFLRAVEWAATGRVALPIPADFPGPDQTSLRKVE
jgi:hypothetical protein